MLINMVAQLNAIIGRPYFKLSYDAYMRAYKLVVTDECKSIKKFDFIAAGPMEFRLMMHYLNGVLNGLRLAETR